MAIDQLPFNVKIPTNEPGTTGIDQLDDEVVEEQVTSKDLPPPGALLMRKPTNREWQAMKNFGKGLLDFQKEVSLDLMPVLGEKRMFGYYDEEKKLLQKAVDEKDYPAIGVHGVGTPIMAAGMWPWWLGGTLVRPLARNVGKAYRIATAPFRKKSTTYLEQANELIGSPGRFEWFTNIINTPRLRTAYEMWLAGLPEYRRVSDARMVRTNLEEFQRLDDHAIDLLEIEGRTAASVFLNRRSTLFPTPSQVLAETKTMVKAHKAQHQVAVKDKTTMLESGSVPTKISEKFTLGESANPVRTGAQTNVSEFLGSEAYDVIAAQNFKQMPVKNMGEYLASLIRSGKLKKEELFDSGLIKLDPNNKVIGGTLYDLNARTPNMVISKQDILKILKEQPAEKLKVQTYRQSNVSPNAYYDLYASSTMMGNTLNDALQKAIFLTKNTAARSKLRAVQKDIQALDKSMYHTANDLNFENSGFLNERFLPMVDRMTALMPKLDEGTQQVLRAYIESTKKLNKLAHQSAVTAKGPIQPLLSGHVGYERSHEAGGQTMAGGFNYSEKVIYLDEAIPFNKSSGRARFTSHFPQDNPIVFTRSKTRYNRKGQQIEVIEEIQSDTLQPFWGDEASKTKRSAMVSPYGNQLTEAYVRRRLNEINKQMEPFLPKNLKKEVAPGQWVNRSITDSELKTLQKLDAEKAELRKFLIKQDARMTVDSNIAVRHSSEMTQPSKVDFFPYLRRSGGVAGYDMLAIKAMIDDALRTGKSGISIAPAGVHGRSNEAGMHMYYGDAKGSKKGALNEESLKKLGRKKPPDAEGIVAIKKIAKQFEKDYGIKLKVTQQPIFNYDPMKLYAIENKSGEIVSSFKTRQNRDFVLAKKNEMSPSGDGFTALNLADGAPGSKDLNKPFFKSIVLEWSDDQAKQLIKKKMSTYQEGGLVAIAPKREYFAAVI